MDYPDRLNVIGGFQEDYIQSEEYALRMYESFPEEYYEQDSIDYLKKEIAWAKEIEANKTWK
jgi:hypothetical protein